MIYILDNGQDYSDKSIFFVDTIRELRTVGILANVILGCSAYVVGVAYDIQWVRERGSISLDEFIKHYYFCERAQDRLEGLQLPPDEHRKIMELIDRTLAHDTKR